MGEKQMETLIIEKESFKVIGMTLETLLSDEREQRNIPKLFEAFIKRIPEIKNRLNDNSIGIFIDPPNYNYKTDKFKWISGVEVSSVNDIPDGMESFIFQANTYARTTYIGPRDKAYTAYDHLYNWVQESEYELADTYGIEYYQQSHDDNHTVMDLMFPIRKNS